MTLFSPVVSSLWCLLQQGCPSRGDGAFCWYLQRPSLPSTSAMLSLPLRDPPGRDVGVLPDSQMRKGLERNMTSLSVEDTVDALPHIRADLNSPAAVASGFQPADTPPNLPLPHPSPHLISLCEGFLQPHGTMGAWSAQQVHPRKARGRGGVSSPPRELPSKNGGEELCPNTHSLVGGF